VILERKGREVGAKFSQRFIWERELSVPVGDKIYSETLRLTPFFLLLTTTHI